MAHQEITIDQRRGRDRALALGEIARLTDEIDSASSDRELAIIAALQAGARITDVASAAGKTRQTVERNYGHHRRG